MQQNVIFKMKVKSISLFFLIFIPYIYAQETIKWGVYLQGPGKTLPTTQ